MSDGSLSQDEIDALLQGTDDVSTDMGSGDFGDNIGTATISGNLLSQAENSAFIDLINSASGNIGGALGAMIGKEVTVSNPKLEIISGSDISNQLPSQVVEVLMDYESGAVGFHSYILDLELAKEIAGLSIGQSNVELNEMTLGAVSEAMNVVSGNSSNTIGTKTKKELRTSPPVIEIRDSNSLSLSPGDNYVKIVFDFTLEDSAPTKLIEIFGLNVVKDIASAVAPATNQMGGGQNQINNNMMGTMNRGNEMPQNMNMGGMQPNMGGMNMNMGGMMMPQNQFQGVQFSSFQNQANESQGGNINLLMDVNMELTVELGRTKKSIKEILGMGEGTVIELDKLAGEPVDILVNGKLVARGEVVVIDENFGVRVTEIISPMDRIRDL